jgi:hypothetical protein
MIIVATILGLACTVIVVSLAIRAQKEYRGHALYVVGAAFAALIFFFLILAPWVTAEIGGKPIGSLVDGGIYKIVGISPLADRPTAAYVVMRKISDSRSWALFKHDLSPRGYLLPWETVKKFEGKKLPITIKVKRVGDTVELRTYHH